MSPWKRLFVEQRCGGCINQESLVHVVCPQNYDWQAIAALKRNLGSVARSLRWSAVRSGEEAQPCDDTSKQTQTNSHHSLDCTVPVACSIRCRIAPRTRRKALGSRNRRELQFAPIARA